MKKNFLLNKSVIIVFSILIIWCLINLFITINYPNIKNYDTITVFFYTLAYSNLSMIQIIGPIFIIYICVCKFNKELHTGSIKNFLTRQNYRAYLKKIFKYSIKISWVLPISMFLLFIFCFFVTKNFNFENAIPKITGYAKDGLPIVTGTISPLNVEFYNTPLKLMTTFFLVIFLHSLLYANIGIIMCKKSKNLVVTVISSFLVFIVINIISEIVIGYIVIRKLGFSNLNGVFNLFGIWVYCDYTGFLPLIIYSIILVVLSYVILWFSYKNKEGVIIESEK